MPGLSIGYALIRLAFWVASVAIVYTYVVFPVVVVLRGRLRHRPYRTGATPTVTLVFASRNEAPSLPTKLDNVAGLDYPREKLQVIVASDGSTDTSERVVEEHSGAGAQFLALPRLGKGSTLNTAISHARGEIVVFSDATSIYRADALRELVNPFADHDVGGVAGNMVYLDPSGPEGMVAGERRYWDFDRLLKRSESSAGSAIGGSGAIYAVRRSLLSPIPDGVADDFFNSLSVIGAGKRLLFAPNAVAYEQVSRSERDEYARKVRVLVRVFRCVWVMRRLLDPTRYGFFAVQLFSHKVLMRTMVLPLAMTAISAPVLAPRRRLYAFAALFQVVFYSLAAIGFAMRRSGLSYAKIFALPMYFCLVNAASAHAIWRLIRRDKVDRWEPRR